ncbi:MAG: ADP-ribosylglycohydrolase family protein [Thermotogota bacterium]|nr:ADP-ribosylglycohydrolase family protein [Thermotogota bacterium]
MPRVWKEALVDIVRGRDTDTNAAICGALLGAVHGQWTECVLTCRPARLDNCMCAVLAHSAFGRWTLWSWLGVWSAPTARRCRRQRKKGMVLSYEVIIYSRIVILLILLIWTIRKKNLYLGRMP